MAKVIIKTLGFKCERCGHEWIPVKEGNYPKICPDCKSPLWDIAKPSGRNGKTAKEG